MARSLAIIERARAVVDLLPLALAVEKRMRREARVRVAHNSTWIENRTLTLDEARRVIEDKAGGDPGRGASQAAIELRNYWAALEFISQSTDAPLDGDVLRQLHAVILRGTRGSGRPRVQSEYRARNLQVGRMEYLPPEHQDVAPLMEAFLEWLRSAEKDVPGPVVAGIATYQFVTIHPFEDGNGRTTRALATLLLARTGYGLNGLASMESFYAADLERYYGSLQMGLHHNYYLANEQGSRSDPDLSAWLGYFLDAFARSADELQQVVQQQARARIPALADNALLRLPPQIRRILAELPELDGIFTPTDISAWFGVSTKTARHWLSGWCQEGYFEPLKPEAERIRTYRVQAGLRERIGAAGLAE